jgi:hypothetical protein
MLAPFKREAISSPLVVAFALLGIADGIYGYPENKRSFSDISNVTALGNKISRDSGTGYYEGMAFAVSYGAGVSEEMLFRGLRVRILRVLHLAELVFYERVQSLPILVREVLLQDLTRFKDDASRLGDDRDERSFRDARGIEEARRNGDLVALGDATQIAHIISIAENLRFSNVPARAGRFCSNAPPKSPSRK